MLFILGQSSQNVSLQSGTVQGKDRATCDGQPPGLCVLLRGNQKLSASTAPPGQQGGDIRNTQHDPSLSCYSQAFRCCRLPVTNASHSAQPVAVSLIGCSGLGMGGLKLRCSLLGGAVTTLLPVPTILTWPECTVRDAWQDAAYYNPKLCTRKVKSIVWSTET